MLGGISCVFVCKRKERIDGPTVINSYGIAVNFLLTVCTLMSVIFVTGFCVIALINSARALALTVILYGAAN